MSKQKTKVGKIIIPNGIYPEKHELETANIFTRLGKDVEFLVPSKTKKAKTPDVIIDGVTWEIKSPLGNSIYNIQNQFKRAAHQSRNLIFDSRRTKMPSNYIKNEIAKQMSLRRSINKLKLITKSGRVIDFEK